MVVPGGSMSAELKGKRGGIGPRPWTVYALLAIMFVTFVYGLVIDTGFGWDDAVGYAIGLVFAVALWQGRTWVFVLSFALSALCVFGLALVFLIQLLVDPPVGQLPITTAAVAAVQLVLLMHPAARRYAGVRPNATA